MTFTVEPRYLHPRQGRCTYRRHGCVGLTKAQKCRDRVKNSWWKLLNFYIEDYLWFLLTNLRPRGLKVTIDGDARKSLSSSIKLGKGVLLSALKCVTTCVLVLLLNVPLMQANVFQSTCWPSWNAIFIWIRRTICFAITKTMSRPNWQKSSWVMLRTSWKKIWC